MVPTCATQLSKAGQMASDLVTKRATAKKNATVGWIDGNLGAEITMGVPILFTLMERSARGTMLSIAFLGWVSTKIQELR